MRVKHLCVLVTSISKVYFSFLLYWCLVHGKIIPNNLVQMIEIDIFNSINIKSGRRVVCYQTRRWLVYVSERVNIKEYLQWILEKYHVWFIKLGENILVILRLHVNRDVGWQTLLKKYVFCWWYCVRPQKSSWRINSPNIKCNIWSSDDWRSSIISLSQGLCCFLWRWR